MTSDPRARVLRAIAWVILAAAVISTPGFFIAERFETGRVLRVAASNGLTALGAIALIRASARGHVVGAARILVFGLLALVAGLAWTSGEGVHANVVNFVLVTVLAGTLLSRGELALVAAISGAAMLAIAWREVSPATEASAGLLESIAQFLPTYAVVVCVLWIARPSRTFLSPSAESPPPQD
jgi:hypothetical protein